MSRDDAKHVAALLTKGRLTRSEAAACLVSLAAALLQGAETPEPDIKAAVPDPPRPPGEDRWLDAEEVGQILGLDPQTVTRRLARVPWRKRIGHRTVRYSEVGLKRWMKTAGF